MKNKQFVVGQKVWHVTTYVQFGKEVCPVCNGVGQVDIRPAGAKGSPVATVSCNFCKDGVASTEPIYHTKVELAPLKIVLTRHELGKEPQTTYLQSTRDRSMDISDCFDSKEEAEAFIEQNRQEREENEFGFTSKLTEEVGCKLAFIHYLEAKIEAQKALLGKKKKR